MTRRKKVSIVCGAIVLIIVANAFFLLHVYLSPNNIARAIKNYARDELGCTVEIATADAGLLGVLELKNIKLFAPGPQVGEPLLTIDQVVIDYSLWRLIWGRNGIDEIEIDKPRLKLDKNLIGFLRGLSSGNGSTERRAILKKISVLSGTIAVDSGILYEHSPALELTDFRIAVESGSYSGSQLTFNGAATQAGVGSVALTGHVDLDAKSVVLNAELPRIEIGEQLRKLLPDSAVVELDDLGLEGQTGIAARMKYEWGAEEHFSQTFVATPSNCIVERVEFPLRLTQVDGELESDGKTLRIKRVTAHYRDGSVEMLRGFIDKKIAEFDIVARNMPLTEEVKQAIPDEVRPVWDDFRITGGKADVEHRITLHKGGGKLFPEHFLRLDLSDIAAKYNEFPYPVSQVGGRVTWITPKQGEQTHSRVEIDLAATAGKGTCEIKGRIPVPPINRPENEHPENYVFPDDSPDITIKAERIELDDKLLTAISPLSQEVVDILDALHATGNVNATVQLKLKNDGKKGSVTSCAVIVDLNGIEITVDEFPYPVTNLTGSVEWDGTTVKLVGLRGLCGEAQVTITGELEPGKFDDPAAKQTINVWIDGLQLETLDDKVFRDDPKTVDEEPQPETPGDKDFRNVLESVIEDFKPKGRANVRLWLSPTADGKVTLQKTDLSLDNCKATYSGFHYPLESLTGHIVVENNIVSLNNIAGRVPGRETGVHISGTIVLDDETDRKSHVTIRAERLQVDDVLKKALAERGDEIWSDFVPSGRINATCILEFNKEQQEESITIELDNCKATCSGFNYPLKDITGKITVKGDTIVLENIKGYPAHADIGTVRVSGKLEMTEQLSPNTGEDSTTTKSGTLNIRAEHIACDAAFDKALPPEWADVWSKANPEGSFSGNLTMIFTPDGPIQVAEGSKLSISGFSLKGFPLPEATCSLALDREAWHITDFKGNYYGGQVEGDIHLNRNDSKWQARINLYDINLKQLNDKYQLLKDDKELRGLMTATVTLAGEGTLADSLKGSAKVQVDAGRLAKLPVIADIVTYLVYQDWPKGSTIKEADIECTIGQGKVDFTSILLKGTTVPISGLGTIGLDGKLDLNFITSKDEKTFVSLIPYLGEPFDKWIITPARDRIFQVEVMGTVREPMMRLVLLEGHISAAVFFPLRAIVSIFKSADDDKKKDEEVQRNKQQAPPPKTNQE
ncbi:MAG: AsmA family protein [Planctomycetes bacterium]|nr:AsmA family protein [Planctomycetota bacterium]